MIPLYRRETWRRQFIHKKFQGIHSRRNPAHFVFTVKVYIWSTLPVRLALRKASTISIDTPKIHAFPPWKAETSIDVAQCSAKITHDPKILERPAHVLRCLIGPYIAILLVLLVYLKYVEKITNSCPNRAISAIETYIPSQSYIWEKAHKTVNMWRPVVEVRKNSRSTIGELFTTQMLMLAPFITRSMRFG